ncbi:MAG: hypothetical protein QMD36_03865 [Candidatus Aenigmarchaeota archaeon]|nr:hypothetical protein [Candidatus Aenigmarchaeota archaeon]
MKKTQFFGIWIYALLCLVLVLIYRFYTGMFEAKIMEYNLSLWYALAINLVLLVTSVISLKSSKLPAILGIIFSPLSTYLFFKSWTEMNYQYLAGFMVIPVILLLTTMVKRTSITSTQPIEKEKEITLK